MQSRVLDQIEKSGYMPWLLSYQESGETLLGFLDIGAVDLLKKDPRFANGIFYGLHRDVGKNLIDFRSYNGTFGKGSLQLVVDTVTGAVYADVDRWNPYQDVVSVVGHLGEVLAGIPRMFRRKKRA
jgi:hypothetical protein